MKLLTIIILIMMFQHLNAQTKGELNVEVTTSETGGKYAPRHVLAIWVEDSTGTFVKTLMAYGNNRRTHLNNWQDATANQGVEYNTTDAISGATQSSHKTRNCKWDATDYQGTEVSDGRYKLCFELTDKNSTGNYSSIDFQVISKDSLISPDDEPSFSKRSILWKPEEVNAVDDINASNNIRVYPGYTKGNINISGNLIDNVQIFNSNGTLIYRGSAEQATLENQNNGVYIIVMQKGQIRISQKLIKY